MKREEADETHIVPAGLLGAPRVLDELLLAAADGGVEQVGEQREQCREEQEL